MSLRAYLLSPMCFCLNWRLNWIMIPERAIFVVPSVREARILLDKEGAFCALQHEAKVWTWEPLQADANYFASNVNIAAANLSISACVL